MVASRVLHYHRAGRGGSYRKVAGAAQRGENIKRVHDECILVKALSQLQTHLSLDDLVSLPHDVQGGQAH